MPDKIENLAGLSLSDIAQLADDARLPPVRSWTPERSGAIDIRIARDGRWFHEGGEIKRPNMVRLFSTVLRREPDGSHVLVTPAERLTITVEDTAFVAVEMKSEGEGKARRLAFRLNTGDLVIAGPDHPLTTAGSEDAPAPTLAVRDGLEARINRAVYYELAAIALAEGATPPGVWSGGAFFPLVAS